MSKQLSFDGTGKFMDFMNFSSFGGEFQNNLMITETNQQHSQSYPSKQISHDLEQLKKDNFKKYVSLCQDLRKQNIQLKKQVKSLKSKLMVLSKEDKNYSSQNSPIREFSSTPQQEQISSTYLRNMQEYQREIQQYKKQIYDEYHKKMREMRSIVDYIVKCYLNYTKNSEKNTKMKRILEDLRQDRSIIKITKLWKQHRKEDEVDGSSLDTNLYYLQKRQMSQLKVRLKEASEIIDCLLNNFRNQVKEMKKDIETVGDKVMIEMKKCMKKYYVPEKENYNHQGNNISSKIYNQDKAIQNVLNSNQNKTEDSSIKLSGKTNKYHRPPRPSTCNVTNNIQNQSRTFTSTPKNYSSTPKNNRSFQNVLNHKSSSKRQISQKKSAFQKK